MKKLINAVDDVVKEQMEGMASAHPNLKINLEPKYIYRADAPVKNKVAIVSGGGSGHEPLHGGFVGEGMLDAACPGEVFTSPTPDQMHACGKAVNSGAGVLFLVKNYTGDVMNFEMAAELLHGESVAVQNVIIDDDVAVKDSLYTAGRRGVGATVIIEKIVGAAAEAGHSLDECADLAMKINRNSRSMGMALSSCATPAAGKPTFDLEDNMIEIGVGIHGEPGRKRIEHTTADEITSILTNGILDDGDYKRMLKTMNRDTGKWEEIEQVNEALKSGDEVIALVNGLGGTPVSELYAVYRKMAKICEEKGIKIARNLVGNYITALEMQGCSITLVKVDEDLLKLWDAPVLTTGLRWGK